MFLLKNIVRFSFFLSCITLANITRARSIDLVVLKNSRNTAFQEQFNRSVTLLSQNLSPSDGIPGSIIAAPSRSHPDYYYHWVRDAALVMDSLMDLYQYPQVPVQLKQRLKSFFINHIKFNQTIQKSALSFLGLGEPKFYVNGTPFTGPWGRPQNDGPALRSSSLMRLYSIATAENWSELPSLASLFYTASLSSPSLIKSDLEYVSHNWMNSSFDLWEEVNGLNFYTLLAQRKSMLHGAFVAKQLKDGGAAQYYQSQYENINRQLDRFWNPSTGYVFATLYNSQSTQSRMGKLVRNKSQLDSGTLLGVLHSSIPNASFGVTDARVFSTYLKLKETFRNLYKINQDQNLGVAIGRYPEDVYDGYSTNGVGNPWFLATAGAAEYLYKLALYYVNSKSININFSNRTFFQQFVKSIELKDGMNVVSSRSEFQEIIRGLASEADLHLLRVIFHTNAKGELSEQFNRDTGFMQGAPNLTWSHASFITAILSRNALSSIYR